MGIAWPWPLPILLLRTQPQQIHMTSERVARACQWIMVHHIGNGSGAVQILVMMGNSETGVF